MQERLERRLVCTDSSVLENQNSRAGLGAAVRSATRWDWSVKARASPGRCRRVIDDIAEVVALDFWQTVCR